MAFDATTIDSKQVLQHLGSSEQGLSIQEATARLQKYGPNQLKNEKRINPFKLFISQFKDILILVLIAAAVLSFVVGLLEEGSHVTESILILTIVLAIAVIGFFNEYKAEKTVEALKKLVGFTAKVRRDNTIIEIPASQIVPGDIILIEEGQKAAADTRLLSVNELLVNEASLTGESVPVSKQVSAITHATSLGDQTNLLFSGTVVSSGNGVGAVVSTGSDTEIGKIAHLVSSVEDPQTPMQKKLDNLGRKIGIVVMFIAIGVFALILITNPDNIETSTLQRVLLAFTAAIALAVAAIPEGLSFVVRISLALGARRMAAKNALVRRLSAVEALGSTDIICTDKTGTLTRGEMSVRTVWVPDKEYTVTGRGYGTEGNYTYKDQEVSDLTPVQTITTIGGLCNNAHIKDNAVIGDPTEGALLVSASKAGLNFNELTKKYPRINEVPFSSSRKMMSTVHSSPHGFLTLSKGATENVLDRCDSIELNGKVQPLTTYHKQSILKMNQGMASEALRVLAFAFKETPEQPNKDNTETKLVFAGLQGMMDPPRQEVKEVMSRVSQEAGMRVVMITGDFIETAKAIASEIGIVGDAMSGKDIANMSDEELASKVNTVSVYARVNPEHKIRIVQALKKQGYQVAMTGDGVNDAPAIKAADIGIAMGITGTDAAKEASDMILLDDQFLTIIGAIEEGRGIFDNMRKFIMYLLGANIAEVMTIVGGLFIFGKLVLSATQLLFINIVTDGLPAIALGSDPSEKGVMNLKPKDFQGSLITKRMWAEMIIYGCLMSSALLFQYWHIINTFNDPGRAAAATFTALVIFELVRLIDIRTDYRISWFSNPWLSVALAGSLLLQLAVVYIQPLANIFEIGQIKLIDWLFITIASIVLFTSMKLVNIVLDKTIPDNRSL